MGELNGEVWDYNTKEDLIANAVKSGLGYVILRVGRDMEIREVW
jgi:hypothetical protein